MHQPDRFHTLVVSPLSCRGCCVRGHTCSHTTVAARKWGMHVKVVMHLTGGCGRLQRGPLMGWLVCYGIAGANMQSQTISLTYLVFKAPAKNISLYNLQIQERSSKLLHANTARTPYPGWSTSNQADFLFQLSPHPKPTLNTNFLPGPEGKHNIALQPIAYYHKACKSGLREMIPI